MKDLINIFMMTLVVIGAAMLQTTNFGYAVLAVAVVYWFKPALDLLHKNYWVGLVFWGGVALFAWPGALVGGLFYGLLATPNGQTESKGNVTRSKRSIRLVSNGYDIETGERVGSVFW
ncbi:hypothetical protein GL272_20015 [Aeromonas veronii]|uniref:hypothetical protein n=1 Tax=Aeromonas TaxID=642 RepID=UPI000640AFD7|nr:MULTISPECIES: hypothetical protein [Aeromonas]AKJ36883.1 hypothetical protein U876_23855 [Aeromonas hydrophila NJ-35]ALZ82590.1 hypothetical protein AhyD4_23565 [Aeromonas hydrophila]MBW3762770.1 hypothetical protein [Aeromonas jandaei]MBW3779163.1 hypothetical protein [Aeromonas veronii]QGW99131.1 hypothetical protein FGM04_21560 [Aeromonas veronii]